MAIFLKANIEDIPELNRLVNLAYRGETAKQGWTHEADLLTGVRIDERGLFTLINKSGTSIIIYRNDNEVLACMLLEQQDDSLYLGMLTVRPELQATGIGKQMLKQAEEEAVSMGISAIRMTFISSRGELIDWYKRQGYQDTGFKKPFPKESEKFGVPLVPLEFIVMEKKL